VTKFIYSGHVSFFTFYGLYSEAENCCLKKIVIIQDIKAYGEVKLQFQVFLVLEIGGSE
jgi:hypothetical protein